jgi:hypothetical protein
MHREFFHAVSHLEPMVQIWSEDPKFQGRSLSSMFHHPIPDMCQGRSITFGEFIDKLNQFAGRHGDTVRQPEAALKDVVIDSAGIYSMALQIINRSRTHSKDLGQLEQLVPLVRELVELVDSMIEVKHFEPLARIDFERDFVLNAKMAMRRRFDRLELFDEDKAKTVAKSTEEKIKPLFAALPGAFQDEMTFMAIILEGCDHGFKQAKHLKDKHEDLAGPQVN